MTTYILHGGRVKRDLPANDKFFAEFTNFPDKQIVNILLCYWARDVDEWDELKKMDITKISEFSQGKSLEFIVATEEQHFLEQVGRADVVYFAGGTYSLLYEKVVGMKDIASLLDSKLVIGSSAGSFLLCKHSLNSFDEQAIDINVGLGLLPFSVLCHWDIEDEKKEKIAKLFEYAPDSPILTLDEGDYVKFVI